MTGCKLTGCVGKTGPNFPVDPNGNIIQSTIKQDGCNTTPSLYAEGINPSTKDIQCRPFQLEDEHRDSEYIETLVQEAINIGGATFNIYALMGIHEQGKLVDCSGNGDPISGGQLPNYPSSNAFDLYVTEWRSIQRGQIAISASSYIGYDFGNIKTNDNSRAMYGIETNIYNHITAFAIKQSDIPTRRVTRARLERSQDGNTWYGVAVVLLPNDNCLNTILVKDSVPSRYWRLRALDFTGSDNDVWAVQALQLYNYTATNENNIQDKIFLENRDREYNTEAISIKGYYELLDTFTELTKYGIELPTQSLYLSVSFNSCVIALGRPLIIGDIIEVPSEAQYSAKLERIEKWMEVTDVGWSVTGFTPGWKPTMLRVVLQPAYASQETRDVLGKLTPTKDATGFVDGNNGNSTVFQDMFDITQTIDATAKDAVPEKGAEGSGSIRELSHTEIEQAELTGNFNISKMGLNPKGLYVEDAIPSNNSPYTEGPVFASKPKQGDYHRLTYEGLSKDVPARLYRYSTIKKNWVFLESDKRQLYNPTKPTLQEFIKNNKGTNVHEITNTRTHIDDECK